MIPPKTCDVCKLPVCQEKGEGAHACTDKKCHGHESEGEKEPQPKVCEKGFCCQHKVGHSCCHGSCPPLPPKDGKDEEGWEEELEKLDGCDRGNFLDGIHCQNCEIQLRAFIHQVAAQAREEGREEGLNEARHAVAKTVDGFDYTKEVVRTIDNLLRRRKTGLMK